MSRKPQVRYFASREAYYTQVDGRQHKLGPGPDDSPSGPNYLAALTAYRDLLALSGARDSKDRTTLRVICDLYLKAIHPARRPNSFALRLKALAGFVNSGSPMLGERAIDELKPLHLSEYLAGLRDKRNGGGLKLIAVSVKAALNWAVEEGYISNNPFKRVKPPEGRSRSRELVVSDELHSRILARTRGRTRELIRALHNTGARPGEVCVATAADFNPQLGAIVYFKDDTRLEGEHRTKVGARDRFIVFTGDTLEMVRGLVAKYPSGPIFKPSCPRLLGNLFWNLRRKLGVKGLCAMSYRHTFATRWLEAGKPIETLAALMGNSPATIRKHYSHLMGGYLRNAADEFAALRKAAEG